MALSSLVSARPSLLPIAGRRVDPLQPDSANSLSCFSEATHAGPGFPQIPVEQGFVFGLAVAALLEVPAGGGASVGERDDEGELGEVSVGEDSAAFELAKQSILSWVYFTGILGPSSSLSTSCGSIPPLVVLLVLFSVFATVHSGLRAYRVLFAGVSLPLALTTIVYFINHRYDGTQLWQVQGVQGIHELVWVASFVSFFFLYPSTFNLLEVAAVDKPKMHLWETGIIRITRHPQMVGQVIWCLAHTLWIGNTVAVAASAGLIAHHLFGVWNGDRRLAVRHGEAFELLKKRTSVLPFAAILDGRQKLPKDYYKEFLRLPYLVISFFTVGAYIAHP
ncbi:unnamed protein product [Spirodela intermedia]|uniref:NnrU domain-containing protein n=1 Tax=Spirodela intermedia TaxID=51605 RepID=A0A7I8IQ15_SPIIN|nr:unnamed protein product [Spirodela intermedia]CAA6659891.1 unnamed protein product [Spirodela intermedia]